MIKTLLTGAIPLALFFYLMMYHPYIIVGLALVSAFILVSYLIGITYREEYGDLRDK